MDKLKRDIELLDLCIEHWEQIKLGLECPTRTGCALCMEYNNELVFLNQCDGCPIKKDTGIECCSNTPYIDFLDRMPCVDYELPRLMHVSEAASAQAMKDYLTQLQVALKGELECLKNSEDEG